LALLVTTSGKSLARQAVIAAVGNRLSLGSAAPSPARHVSVNNTVIQGVRRFEGGSFTRLVIDLNATPDFTATSSTNSLTVKFNGDDLGTGFQQNQSETNGLVKQVLTTKQNGTVDMKLLFRAGTSFAAFTLGAPPRLVIDVRDNESTDSELEAELGGMYTPLGNSGIKRIVIDAGHGGRDYGAVGPDGYAEKDLTLDIARTLKHDIESRLGIEVELTRDGDYYVPLATRSQKANGSGADLFISLHANAADSSGAQESGSTSDDPHGIETYFLSRATSTAAEQIAARENGDDGVAVPLVQSNGAKVIESHMLATYIQRSLVRGLRQVSPVSARDRGVKQAPFYVLNNTEIPSVLVEVSFITTRDDQKRLRTGAFRQKISDSILNGVRTYILNQSQQRSGREDQVVIR